MTDTVFNTSFFQNLVYNFHQTIQPLNIKLIYEGEVDCEVVKVFTNLTERGLKLEKLKAQKKVFNVVVECLQNIIKHSDYIGQVKQGDIGNGLFLISNNNKEWLIVTGNIINKNKETVLTEKIDYINSLSPEDLRSHYKTVLKDSEISSTGGAGLGFIDIARKTKNKISYNFHHVKEGFSFFIMSAKISK